MSKNNITYLILMIYERNSTKSKSKRCDIVQKEVTSEPKDSDVTILKSI